MQSDYRFAKIWKGIPSFARVYIEIVKRADNEFIVVDNTGRNDMQISTIYAKWIVCAMNGCRKAVDWLRTLSLPHGFDIKLKEIQFTYVDTCEDAVECAAFLAVAKAFSLDSKCTIKFDDRWKVIPPLPLT